MKLSFDVLESAVEVYVSRRSWSSAAPDFCVDSPILFADVKLDRRMLIRFAIIDSFPAVPGLASPSTNAAISEAGAPTETAGAERRRSRIAPRGASGDLALEARTICDLVLNELDGEDPGAGIAASLLARLAGVLSAGAGAVGFSSSVSCGGSGAWEFAVLSIIAPALLLLLLLLLLPFLLLPVPGFFDVLFREARFALPLRGVLFRGVDDAPALLSVLLSLLLLRNGFGPLLSLLFLRPLLI